MSNSSNQISHIETICELGIAIAKMRKVLEKIHNPREHCQYDHSGNCQTHRLDPRPCPYETAGEILADKDIKREAASWIPVDALTCLARQESAAKFKGAAQAREILNHFMRYAYSQHSIPDVTDAIRKISADFDERDDLAYCIGYLSAYASANGVTPTELEKILDSQV